MRRELNCVPSEAVLGSKYQHQPRFQRLGEHQRSFRQHRPSFRLLTSRPKRSVKVAKPHDTYPPYSVKTLVSRQQYKIAIAKIPTQRSRPQRTTMQRSFGTQISGNRRPGTKLLEATRARIIATSEARVLKPKITAEYRVNWLTIYDTINQQKNHHTLKFLPKPGQLEELT